MPSIDSITPKQDRDGTTYDHLAPALLTKLNRPVARPSCYHASGNLSVTQVEYTSRNDLGAPPRVSLTSPSLVLNLAKTILTLENLDGIDITRIG